MIHNSAESICLIDAGEVDRNFVTSHCCEALLLIAYILLFSGLKPTSGPFHAGICWKPGGSNGLIWQQCLAMLLYRDLM